jgi:hypothetical protein
MQDKDKVHGEGNYAASKQYNDATRKFVQSGKVDEAARKAAPGSEREADEMRRAEDAGKRRAKEEDPELFEGEDEDLLDSDDEGDSDR